MLDGPVFSQFLVYLSSSLKRMTLSSQSLGNPETMTALSHLIIS